MTHTTESSVPSITVSELRAALGGDDPPIVIDVRKAPAFQDATTMIAGALRREPQSAAEWARSLPPASSIVVYCVHGHEVSQGAARALAAHGLSARYLEGGIEAWLGAGGPVDRK